MSEAKSKREVRRRRVDIDLGEVKDLGVTNVKQVDLINYLPNLSTLVPFNMSYFKLVLQIVYKFFTSPRFNQTVNSHRTHKPSLCQ